MASLPTTTLEIEKPPPTNTILRHANNRRSFWRLRRKKRLPQVRLGGQRQQGGRSVMVKMIRRIRFRWTNLKKIWALKKLKEYYLCILKDLTENDRSIEKHQQMLLMETSFAIPVMGMSFNSFR
ncbi:hypothetical protein CTI12_AA017560 [Artemisia annua]|uniref:Uncharacterized protein n=1 Tax=Artemisia annua TaxID=35608 RepID=A0A2U1QKE4_ARTAN|nr:hypothetical protein CTI12_AA017560 [Artemisia annua]